MFFCEKRGFSTFLLGSFVATGVAVAAPSVRKIQTPTAVMGAVVTHSNPTTTRSGVLPVATSATTVSRAPATVATVSAPIAPTTGNRGLLVGGKNVSSKSVGTQLFDSLQQQIDALREYYESLPSRDQVAAIETELETTYAKKADFNNLQFAVQGDDNAKYVKYSVDGGASWDSVAPVSAFAGKDGCAPTITSREDTENKRIVLTINNCGTNIEAYIPFGQEGPQGQQGAPGQDACTPHFESSKADGVTTITYTCGETNSTFEIADGQDASTEDLESVKRVLGAVASDWTNIDDTIDLLDQQDGE